MDLILWRHAEAEDSDGQQPDHKRRLTARGEKQARRMAGWLRRRLSGRVAVLASPTERTRQTAHALGLPFEVATKAGPGATARELLAVVGWSESKVSRDGTVILVGHQPTLGQLAALLLAGEEADWTIRKGAVWWFSNRMRDGATRMVLKAVVHPDLL